MTGEAAEPDSVIAAFRQARAARTAGDLAAARRHLEAALDRAAGDPPDWLQIFEADLLRSEGRTDAARALLETLARRFPDNIWPDFHLAGMAREAGDTAAALDRLGALIARGAAGRNIWVRLLEADLLLDDGREAEARAVLSRAATDFPGETVPHRRLAQLAERRGDPARARAHYENALALAPDDAGLQLSVVRQLRAEGLIAAAIQRLEILHRRCPGDMRVLMQLVQLNRAESDTEREQIWLALAVEADPLHPDLLTHLFTTRARTLDYPDLAATLDRLRPAVGDARADELLVALQLQAMRFDEAFARLQREGPARRTAGEARNLATALFGVHRYRLGLRYLRFCLRRWPGDEGLWSVYVVWALKLGRPEAVARLLDERGGALPGHLQLEHRFTLAGFRNDLATATACYAALRDRDRAADRHRSVLGKMIYSLQDLATIEPLFARIGNPGAEGARLLHRGGLVGMMTLELDLERRALQEDGGHASPADWVTARPDSTIAAIRLVDAWRGDRRAAPRQAGESRVPRRIWQYWDAPDRPGALAPMIDSWARAPGFAHRLLDRAAAVRYLRTRMGEDWVRAFHLAQDAAQEADLLRLCLLARDGGVWADADDVLYGDLDAILRAGPELVLYREPLGGAVANNLIAAPAGHPVVVHAARLACRALLQRANENAWNKTGPGLLTRAVAHYLAQAGFDEARRRLTVLDWTVVARQVAANNPVAYKTSRPHWSRAGARRPWDAAWEKFRTTALDRVGPRSGPQA